MNQSTDLWLSALQHLNDPVVITEAQVQDGGGRAIVFANEAFCRMCGYQQEELIGRTAKILQGPGTNPKEMKRIGEALRENRPVRAELLNYRKSGQPYWIEISISPLRDERGEVTHFVAVERELHGRSGGQTQAVTEHLPLDQLRSASAQVLLHIDLVNDGLSWTSDLTHLFGFRLEHLPLTISGLLELIHPDDLKAVSMDLDRCRERDRAICTIEMRVRGIHATYIPTRTLAKVIRDADGNATHLVGALVDLSERSENRRSILTLAERLTTVVESIADSLIVTDRKGEITFVNNNAIRLFRKGREILGRLWLDVLPSMRTSAVHDGFVAALETLEPQHVEFYDEVLELWLAADIFPSDDSVSIFYRDVTYRIRTEDELRKALKNIQHSRESLQWIYDHTLDVICTLDFDARIVDISASSYSVFGYHPEEVRGRHGFDFVHPDDVEATIAQHSKTLAGGRVSGFVNRMIHKDGTVVHVMWSSRWYEENQIVVAVARDVTESERFHALVKSERDELTHAQRMAKLGTWRLHSESGRLELSSELTRMFHWLEPEVPTTIEEFLRFIHPEDETELLRIVDEEAASSGSRKSIIRILPARDRMLVVGVVSEQSNDPVTGEPMFFGTMQDNTEQIRLRESLLESEGRFNQVFEKSPVALLLMSASTGRVLAANRSARTLYGYEESECVGISMNQFVVEIPEESENAQKDGTESGEDPVAKEQKTRAEIHRKKDGTTFPAQVFYNQMEYLGQRSKLLLVLDISEQRKLEEKLRHSTKMEAVGQLAGGIAHDFNNILTVISGFTMMAIEDAEGHPEVVEKLGHVRDASKQAAELTKQLLAFSRKQVLKPVFIPVSEVLDSVNPLLQRLLPENVDIRYTRRNAEAMIHADPVQIQQVLMNLVINARDAMPHGGRLTIETALLTRRHTTDAEPGAIRPGQYVMIAVSDTGIGMSKAVRERAFEPFFTTKPKGQGTGLGLSTVYGIVRQMGGDAHIYSELDKGTTVRVYLPQHRQARTAEESAREASALVSARNINALVVEDDPLVRDYVTKVLRGNGYYVVSAQDGPGAIEQAANNGNPVFDLLVTDVVLPRVSGRQVATTIRGLLPNIAVVFMSGYTEDAIVNQGVLDPGIHFLSKPFSPEELLERIELALQGDRRPLGSSILIVTQQQEVRDLLHDTLRPSGHNIASATSSGDAVGLCRQTRVDMVVLDMSITNGSAPLFATQLMAEIKAAASPAKILVIEPEGIRAAERLWPTGLVPDAVLHRPLDGARILAVIHSLVNEG